MLHAALSGIGFDPAGRAKLGVAEGTARRGPGGPDVAPGAVSRRTTVAGWPARVLTPVPAAALNASNADFTMDVIETACRITKDSIAGAAGERLKLRSWQRGLIWHLYAVRSDGRLRHRQASIGMPGKQDWRRQQPISMRTDSVKRITKSWTRGSSTSPVAGAGRSTRSSSSRGSPSQTVRNDLVRMR